MACTHNPKCNDFFSIHVVILIIVNINIVLRFDIDSGREKLQQQNETFRYGFPVRVRACLVRQKCELIYSVNF